ncbi:hypothetical protein RF55_15533 [Lasius niger]|uniref:Uncharacterized protein n=1 Tax=Lasius niger TaxID=67767 RepID=A0A0J7K6C3_LASNI|nr:hypothetical protein RF55_15533 [Lasius niger]
MTIRGNQVQLFITRPSISPLAFYLLSIRGHCYPLNPLPFFTALPSKKREWRPRLPRKAAVLLTVSGEATKAVAIKEARSKLKLESFEIPYLLPKRTANGNFLLEVPGKDVGQKADRLFERMAGILKEMEVVRVSRPPTKPAELRERGLEGSATFNRLRRLLPPRGAARFRRSRP